MEVLCIQVRDHFPEGNERQIDIDLRPGVRTVGECEHGIIKGMPCPQDHICDTEMVILQCQIVFYILQF